MMFRLQMPLNLIFPGDTLVKLLMHSSDDVTCVALEALLAIFTNGNLEQKKVSQIKTT